jgi:hypothetical protein
MRKSANESGTKEDDCFTAAARLASGPGCVVTDYDQVDSAPLAMCEIRRIDQNLTSVGAAGDFK